MAYIYDAAVIGAGASGLMLAANLDLEGARGIVLEGSLRMGSKLLMSGGGRCNITHGGPIKEFVNCYGAAGTSLRRCLYRHSNAELASWFTGAGVALASENGEPLDVLAGAGLPEEAGRVFPASMKSKDVLDALTGAAERNMWQTEAGAKVTGLTRADADGDVSLSGLWNITLDGGHTVTSRNVVIASGGITYPETGSDGSVSGLLRGLGVEISEMRPALAPVYVKDYPYTELSGISLPEVTVTAFGSDAACTCKGKAGRMTGDLLFTHNGFSGPVILDISRYAEPGQLLRIKYNKEFTELPKRMQRVLEDRARGPSGDIRTKLLASLLDHDDFTVERIDERGMVTAGGVALSEVDMSTMQLKRFDGLYVIGEALDADGRTGGYNLQMCWSTACTCADALREKTE